MTVLVQIFHYSIFGTNIAIRKQLLYNLFFSIVFFFHFILTNSQCISMCTIYVAPNAARTKPVDLGKYLVSLNHKRKLPTSRRLHEFLPPSHHLLLLLVGEPLRTLLQRLDQNRHRLRAEIRSVAQFVDVVCELGRDLFEVVGFEILLGRRCALRQCGQKEDFILLDWGDSFGRNFTSLGESSGGLWG